MTILPFAVAALLAMGIPYLIKLNFQQKCREQRRELSDYENLTILGVTAIGLFASVIYLSHFTTLDDEMQIHSATILQPKAD